MDKITPDKKDIESNKVLAAVGYIWILCLVPLFLKQKSKFAQFHAKQGLLLFIIELVGWIIPVIGWILFVVAIIYAILGVKAALEGKYWEMPVLGKYAAKLNL
ncbi:MAG: hypothetical protein COV55_04785 [Candidatus Komeilibacteria bacterium CG11_big_fil_rev_8_21_14_0_20_36_20]|uniref:DUF4870 domain-containing protein n=1 Tax=Candidatus Komeilibacteria bacterium CG11_big_fil_rev_8_21_14_0_20_36_20 TaxID=1974477 RepID=A0A2H0NBB9_9BACT|nr:MAG: hypothetical protein COV55_04785 [Candidatus Komeilibacteria bacterium CG11_big_fil_rev_8_21_14_0_20_36_20]PIR81870.1 MAG: hypothetical protein COU21_01695 [Candidatus Komeilibacteria bacterium CG10_big_fil_rev_8_21_14_0_10_36_65]PJC55078.1 MAG: hypothetical protein CO027_04050 [Candidatus Komeilibacteria bacterium CG_4_9_14_0_2_um_filter_36_13]